MNLLVYGIALFSIVMLLGSPQAQAQYDIPPMKFEIQDEVTWEFSKRDPWSWGPQSPTKRTSVIVGKGGIVPGTSQVLRDFLFMQGLGPALHHGMTLYLNSPGGSVADAIKLGRVIREHKLNTRVGGLGGVTMASTADGICVSACTLAFLGGIERSVQFNAIYAVHRFFRGDRGAGTADMDVAQLLAAEIQRYMREMEVDARLLELWVRAGDRRPKEPGGSFPQRQPGDEPSFYILSATEMANLKVVTTAPIKVETHWNRRDADEVVGSTVVGAETYEVSFKCHRALDPTIKMTFTWATSTAAARLLAHPIVIAANVRARQLLDSEVVTRSDGQHFGSTGEKRITLDIRLTPRLLPIIEGGGELSLSFGDPFIHGADARKFSIQLDSGRTAYLLVLDRCR